MSYLRIELKVDLLVQSREGLFRLDLLKSAKEVVESERPPFCIENYINFNSAIVIANTLLCAKYLQLL